jgi:hypothetical protein
VIGSDCLAQALRNLGNVAALNAEKIPLQTRRIGNADKLLATFEVALRLRWEFATTSRPRREEAGVSIVWVAGEMAFQSDSGSRKVVTSESFVSFSPVVRVP